MKRIHRFAFAVAVAVSGLATTGCLHGGGGGSRVPIGERYRNAVDPSWPERYNHTARLETLAPFQVQAQNGAYLDQTVWNYHFENGSDKLTAAGTERLDYLVRKRGTQDGKIYLQTARDMGYDPNMPEKYADMRRDIDQRRAASIHKYLAAQTAAAPVNFEIQVHDPADPGFPAQYLGNAVRALPGQYSASLGVGGGGGGAVQMGGGGGGGAAATGGGGGAGAGSTAGGAGGGASSGGYR